MSKQLKIGSVLLMIVWLASFAAAAQKPAVQTAGPMNQLLNSAQDVITASDAGGGYLTTRDILLIVIIIFAVIGLLVVLAR